MLIAALTNSWARVLLSPIPYEAASGAAGEGEAACAALSGVKSHIAVANNTAMVINFDLGCVPIAITLASLRSLPRPQRIDYNPPARLADC